MHLVWRTWFEGGIWRRNLKWPQIGVTWNPLQWLQNNEKWGVRIWNPSQVLPSKQVGWICYHGFETLLQILPFKCTLISFSFVSSFSSFNNPWFKHSLVELCMEKTIFFTCNTEKHRELWFLLHLSMVHSNIHFNLFQELIQYLKYTCPAHLYATSISPPAAQQIISSIKVILGEDGSSRGGKFSFGP